MKEWICIQCKPTGKIVPVAEGRLFCDTCEDERRTFFEDPSKYEPMYDEEWLIQQKEARQAEAAARLTPKPTSVEWRHGDCDRCGLKDTQIRCIDGAVTGICEDCFSPPHNFRALRYKCWQPIENSHLVAVNYYTQPLPTWQCACGRQVQMSRRDVENCYRRSCGHIDCTYRHGAKPSKYQIGDKIPGTYLTFHEAPNIYKCECGNIRALNKYQVNTAYRKSCGECSRSKRARHCILCRKPGHDGLDTGTARLCLSCIIDHFPAIEEQYQRSME